MPGERDPIRATRILLSEVCALMSAHADDAVLIGGWVPDVRFPNARPAHVGSIDVDFALRLERTAHNAVVELLLRNGFRPGAHSYQFLKDIALGHGRTIAARLDLLTSVRHHAKTFGGEPSYAPHPIRGADVAFQDNSMETIGADGTVQIRVAGIASFIVMKSIALAERAKPKDAYDIHFCLENYPDGPVLLAEQFAPLLEQEDVREALRELARHFHDEEADGPRMVADVEEVMGEARAIRKLAAATRVREFLDLMGIAP